MCKNSEKCQKGENCSCQNKKETFQKTKQEGDINVRKFEEIKPKNHGKETFGI